MKSQVNDRLSAGGAILFAAVVAASNAAGQEAETQASALEEVIVTAQKRQENLQDVPISIAVATGEQLNEANVEGLLELSRALPGFDMAPGVDSKDASPRIRGIGTSSYSNAIEPSVATVVDGVVLGRQGMNLFNFDDVARVEMLRGPQGTLFGINSSAGVLNIATKNPTSELSGNLRASYGSYDRLRVNGAISGPIVENKLLGRLSFFTDKRDGYVHNRLTGQDLNWDDQKGARAKLLFTPRDQTSITVIAEVADQDRSSWYTVPIAASANPLSQQFLGEFARPGNNQMNSAGVDGGSKNQVKGGSLQWEEAIGGHTLTFITAYRSWDHLIDTNVNRTPIVFFDKIFYESNQGQWSHELRLASSTGGFMDYVVGAFLFDQNLKASTDLRFDVGQPGSPFFIRAIYDEEVDLLNYAGFGEVNFHITDALTLLAGARWSHVKQDARVVGRPIPADEFRFLVPEGVLENSATDSKWSGRVGARWQFSPDDMVYVTATRGFKSSAFNTVTSTNDLERVRPEIPTSFEVGLKSEWLANRLRTNLALFHTTFKDFQAQAGFRATVDAQPIFILQNAGELETQGVEFELEALPLENLTLNLSATYIDAAFKDFRNAGCFIGQTAEEGCLNGVQDLSGTRLPYTPEWSAYTSARYDFALPVLPLDAFVRADFSWRDNVQWDLANHPDNIEDAYGLLGASFGIRDRDDRYVLTVYGENLTNKTHGYIFGAGSREMGANPALSQQIPPDYKRIYGVSFEYYFQ